MRFYLDENLPPNLARALDLINSFDNDGSSVYALVDTLKRGVTDEEWIPKLGKEGAIVITQDYNIHQTREQRELYMNHGLGVFFLKSPSKNNPYTYWEMVRELVSKWVAIKKICQANKIPFAFRITQRKIEKLV